MSIEAKAPDAAGKDLSVTPVWRSGVLIDPHLPFCSPQLNGMMRDDNGLLPENRRELHCDSEVTKGCCFSQRHPLRAKASSVSR